MGEITPEEDALLDKALVETYLTKRHHSGSRNSKPRTSFNGGSLQNLNRYGRGGGQIFGRQTGKVY